MDSIYRKGVCCIVLSLEPKKFNTMTFKKFSELPREKAIRILGERILNNMDVTYHAIQFCIDHGYCYRLSSSLFPLITYDKAKLELSEIFHYPQIVEYFNKIKSLIQSSDIRISCHPSEFNVLASTNQDAVQKTITELNFYGWFMTQIGCPLSYDSPMNLHVNNSQGDFHDIHKRFIDNMLHLSDDVRKRLVIENDDKQSGWSIRKLVDIFHANHSFPITFDYLHHKCHPDGLSEKEAFEEAYLTWGNHRPLFHYSETRPDQSNPRRHADFPTQLPNTYGCSLDIDYEFKMKEKSFDYEIKSDTIAL